MKYKYVYIGTEPALLIDHHIECKPGDVIEVEDPINNVLFNLVEDKPKKDGGK